MAVGPTQNRPPAPPDPEIAVREEFELALSRETIEALQLFAERHSGHRLSGEALLEIERLRGVRIR